ncbi:HmuY family protein [Pedobacter metabolipauper]|uniref:Heme-binding HmuY-like protein n=1 Tax=Pedobacter metabolipauper TaxID=425513 RepID=A0A4R6SU03_9SPHI|nr:HmuY family protein [Pedobacter metabolipauper]TDQ08250.1 heme-binding HmuY-like protein [Pedobacter metabolipauper]
MEKLIRRYLWLFLVVPLTFTACKKKEENPSNTLEDGKSTVIYDLAGDTNGSVGDPGDGKTKIGFDVFLFRLADQRQTWLRNAADSARWLQTAEWDLAFTGPYNSEIFLNNASYSGNPGYAGTVTRTAVILVKQAYENVSTAPSDNEFDSAPVKHTKIGTYANDNPNGWFTYDLTTHLMKRITNNTYVLRLADGKYAKLEILSVYKGNPPVVTQLYWPAPYFTFRYFVQQDGSRNLNTK